MSKSHDFRWPERWQLVTSARNRVKNGTDPGSRYWPTGLDLAIDGPVTHEHNLAGHRLVHTHSVAGVVAGATWAEHGYFEHQDGVEALVDPEEERRRVSA